MTDEIKRILRFDERRKILEVDTVEEKEAINEESKINGGHLTFSSKASYNEDGIRMILGNANKTKDDAEKFIPMCRTRIKEIEEGMAKASKVEMTPELRLLDDNLKKLKTFHDSEPQQKELDNLRAMLKNAEENLRKSSKDIQEIKGEIGSRLNL